MTFYKANFIVWAVVFICIARPPYASAAETEEPEAVSLRVRYLRGGVNDIVAAQVTAASVYVSIRELFALLHVDCEIESSGSVVRGFYCSLDRRYEINIERYTARIDRDTSNISSADVIVIGREPFFSAKFLERMFHLSLAVEMNQLKAVLRTEEMLPVAAERERDKSEGKLNAKNSSHSSYPLLYGRNRTLFGGGVADYIFTGVHSGGNSSLSAAVRGGAEVLDG